MLVTNNMFVIVALPKTKRKINFFSRLVFEITNNAFLPGIGCLWNSFNEPCPNKTLVGQKKL